MRPADSDWRSVLARRLALLLLVLDVLGTALASVLQYGYGRSVSIAGGIVTGVLLCGALQPGLGQRSRSWLVVSAFLTVGVAGVASVGFLSAPSVATLLAVLVAALLLGTRPMATVFAIATVAIGGIALGMITDFLPAPSILEISPTSPRAWVRTVGLSLLLTISGGAMVVWVVRRLEGISASLRMEMERRVEAEVARRKAEQLAMETQRLELVGRIAAGLVHDLNNHLAVISMSNSQLDRGRLSKDQQEEASRAISDSVRHATALTKQLLVFGRGETGTVETLELRRLVDDFTPSLRRILPAGIALSVEHDDHAQVRADPTRLHQAILNFVVNARDALEAGGKIDVRTRVQHTTSPTEAAGGVVPPGRWSVIEVEDNGTGIDDETRRRAFEPFFTTKPTDKGTGIGLSTVALIAEASGGYVVLSTEVGKGTTIGLWLPSSGASEARAKAPSSKKPTNGAQELRGTTILLVEDEPKLLAAAEALLVLQGCRVLRAADGSEAVRVLRSHRGPIDLLCTDVVMPGVPVTEVIALFEERHPGKPVLTCSGYVGEELVSRGIGEGRYALLEKPFTEADLRAAVLRVLASSRSECGVETGAEEEGTLGPVPAAPRPC